MEMKMFGLVTWEEIGKHLITTYTTYFYQSLFKTSGKGL